MSKTQRFFRTVWRINAISILFASGAVAGMTLLGIFFSVSDILCSSAKQQEVDISPEVGVLNTGERLLLRSVSLVPGTTVFRGELGLQCKDYRYSISSLYSGDFEVRNLLFIKDGESTGRWLLPDNNHLITEHKDISPADREENRKPPVATVVLVKPIEKDIEVAEGTLLLFSPTGEHVQTVATGVRAIQEAAIQDNRLLLFFERQKKYVIAMFDVQSLAKNGERELEIPELK